MDIADIIKQQSALIEETVADCVARGVTDDVGIMAALVSAHERQRARMDEMLGELHEARMSDAREMPAWYNYIATRLYNELRTEAGL